MKKNLYAFCPGDPQFPVITAMIRDAAPGKQVDLHIASQDEMYSYGETVCGGRPIALMAYFRAGIEINKALRQLVRWKFGTPDKIGTFLDFASGHGRSTRFTVADLSPERMWAADILKDAVNFQREQFHVNALQSATDLDFFHSPVQYDCIFVCSLFTHLPERTFTRWLTKLFSLLKPDGLLIFSVHGDDLLPKDASMPRQGIYFMPLSEIAELKTEDYGATIVTESFVSRAIERATGRSQYVRIAKGLTCYQDIYLIANGALPSSQLNYEYGAQGCLDFCVWESPGEFEARGWAVDITPGHTIREIQILYNGELIQTCRPAVPRPDIAVYFGNPGDATLTATGWQCRFTPPRGEVSPFSDILMVKAICSAGSEYFLDATYLHRICRFGRAALPPV